MKLRCLIVDDEPLARKGLSEYVQDIAYLQLTVALSSATQANDYIKHHAVDLMLLDIRMPKLSGIDFLKSINEPPLVIFTTAYPGYALESYSLDVIDYLVKPIPFERFKKATQKAFDYFSLTQQRTQPDYFFIKCDHKLEKVAFVDVLYVEAMQNYCILHTPARKMICYITLTHMLEKLPTDRFIKVHKSFIVATEKVTALDGHELKIGNVQIPISRNLKGEVMMKVMGNKLFKR